MGLTPRSLKRSLSCPSHLLGKVVCARQARKPSCLLLWGSTHSPWLPGPHTDALDLEWVFFTHRDPLSYRDYTQNLGAQMVMTFSA